MYLVQANDSNCNWTPKDNGVEPQCSRVELMEANIYGFKAASFPCEFDSCPSGSDSTVYVDYADYGPGSDYKIDSTRPFTVKSQFFAMEQEDGTAGDLMRIETHLIQGTNLVTIVQDNADLLYTLQSKL